MSSLVTRMTTDVTNVQMAYMMIVRTAIRCPLMLVFSFVMAFIMGGKMAVIFLLVIPVLGVGLALVVRSTMPLFKRCLLYTSYIIIEPHGDVWAEPENRWKHIVLAKRHLEQYMICLLYTSRCV